MRYAGEKCCGQQPGPNLAPFPQTVADGEWTVTFQDFGGERVGAVLLSPFLKPGTVSDTQFNHYALLKTVEDLLGTRDHLGYAGQPGLVGFFEPAAGIALLTRPALAPDASPLPGGGGRRGPRRSAALLDGSFDSLAVA